MNNTPVERNSNMTTTMVTSPTLELVNISSSSGEEFRVESYSLPELEDRFRIPHSDLIDLPTAFVSATGVVLFARDNEMGNDSEHQVDTRGSAIENNLMDLLDDAIDVSPLTFICSSEDETDPFLDANFCERGEIFLWAANTTCTTYPWTTSNDQTDCKPSNNFEQHECFHCGYAHSTKTTGTCSASVSSGEPFTHAGSFLSK